MVLSSTWVTQEPRWHVLQTGAEDARFECARKMTELESRKRYEFLEAMVSSMDAHLRFFERGHEVRSAIKSNWLAGPSKFEIPD